MTDAATQPSTPTQPLTGRRGGVWRVDGALILLTLVVYGYFHGGGLWNQNARFDAILAFVEPVSEEFLSFRIDRFVTDPRAGINTGDWAYHQGHFYANKAPGTIFLGLPFYAVVFTLERVFGVDFADPDVRALNLYLINLFVSAGTCAAGLVLFRRLLARSGIGDWQAICATLALGFGTMLFPYSTQLWGHPTATAFLMMALWGLLRGGRAPLFLAGLCAGMAAASDYLAGIAVITMGVFALVSHRRRAVWYVAGGLPVLAMFMLYHRACFGSCFVVANRFENPIFREGGSFLHLNVVTIAGRVVKLLVSRYRGLLLHMPILVLSVAGLVRWFRRTRQDALAWLCLGNVVLYLGVNAMFNGWHGGSTVCARYQIVALPFWCVPLKELPWRGRWRGAFGVLGAVSALNMLTVAAVTPTSPYPRPEGPPAYYNPLYNWTYRQFLAGRMAPIRAPFEPHAPSRWSACNGGHLLGLDGLASLLPLLVLATVATALLVLAVRSGRAPPEAPPGDVKESAPP